MKTRNQFLPEAIRLLFGIVFVALIGIGFGNFARNQKPLLIEVSKTVVCPAENIIITNATDLQYSELIGVLTKMNEYTCNIPRETMMNAYSLTVERTRQITMSGILKMPTVYNRTFRRPPRSDMICVNTS